MHQGLRLYILTYIRICSSDGLKYVVSRFEHWLTRSQILYKYFEKKEKKEKKQYFQVNSNVNRTDSCSV